MPCLVMHLADLFLIADFGTFASQSKYELLIKESTVGNGNLYPRLRLNFRAALGGVSYVTSPTCDPVTTLAETCHIDCVCVRLSRILCAMRSSALLDGGHRVRLVLLSPCRSLCCGGDGHLPLAGGLGLSVGYARFRRCCSAMQ
ncbi:hypothetical protein KC19_7G048100 [Ceratodon purpureus]|uniref:Secreted protein n=1 Tax=Ceratodon purpureus TaxID=3225 RepID=A0A8T0H2W5_CERPU|nr:hypothetical protein KC19_7G048100 [Ceratodon purpureus]